MRIYDNWISWPEARVYLKTRLAPDTPAALDQAFAFAIACHGEQTRPNGEPYTLHLLEVVEILWEGVGIADEEILLAGVLHDVVEDTSCSLDEIRARFGIGVANLVEWLTMPNPLPKPRQAKSKRKPKAT